MNRPAGSPKRERYLLLLRRQNRRVRVWWDFLPFGS